MADIDHTLLPICSVDGVLLTIEDETLKVLLHLRPNAPCEGMWALPGGFVHKNEDNSLQAAMARVLKAKVKIPGLYLEQLASYGGPNRDPRGWSVSVAHLGVFARKALPLKAESEDIKLFPVSRLPKCAFDHRTIIKDAVKRLRGKGAYSVLPTKFLGDTFTLYEACKVYEHVLGEEIAPGNFRRKILALDVLEPTGEMSVGGRKRPAELYRLKSPKEAVVFDRGVGSL